MGEYALFVDCCEEEVRSFADEFMYNGHRFEVYSFISNGKRTGICSEVKRYAIYFGVGFRAFLNRKHYRVLAGWQQFYALIFCFFCEIFRVRKTVTVIALNYTYKEKTGWLARLYRWFMEKCMSEKYLDYIHVPSSAYADMVAQTFRFPRERILVTCFGINDDSERMAGLQPPQGYEKESYALAIGRSNRDYDFLISAWEGIDYPLVIISDTYEGTAKNEHVLILRNVAGAESEPWIANCGLMIIPIDDGSICSGDTVLLTAMSLKRRIIVTKPSTLAEMYVVDGKNALLVPKEKSALQKMVADVLNTDQYASLGEGARNSFLQNHSRSSMGRKYTELLNNHVS